MRFKEWADAQLAKTEVTRTAFFQTFGARAGVSATLLGNVYAGMRMKRLDKAQAISVATNGRVSVKDLYE